MIELKILIDELDYDSIADYLIPALAESMAKERKGGVLAASLPGIRRCLPPWHAHCCTP